MQEPAAPAAGRRLPRGLFGALVVFLFLPLPPLCLAGPLLARMLIWRPRTPRAWAWTGGAALLAAATVTGGTPSVARDVVLVYGAAFTAGFLALRTWRPGPVFARAAVAAVDAALLVAVGGWALGLEWGTVHAAFAAQFRPGVDFVVTTTGMTAERADALRRTMDALAVVYPGVAILGAMAGGPLAEAIAWHVAGRPDVLEPAPLRTFRFNDHLVWGAILTLGLALASLAPPWPVVAANALAIWIGLYVARGVAVALARSGAWPRGARAALFLGAVLLLPYALGALLLVGLADTWLDFRRPMTPPNEGDSP